jgi:hypothetical protein
VLPAIGCAVAPFVHAGLAGLLLSVAASGTRLMFGLIELALFAFSTFTSVSFFLKKRFVPHLMIAWLVFNLLTVIAHDAASSKGNGSGILRSLIALFIWGPYFLVSRRVKLTFVR